MASKGALLKCGIGSYVHSHAEWKWSFYSGDIHDNYSSNSLPCSCFDVEDNCCLEKKRRMTSSANVQFNG
jgi:hypothetical protein